MKKVIRRRVVSRKKGFTLVEMLAVMGVIGVLLAVVLIASRGARQASKISTTAQQVQFIYSACQSWLGNGRTDYSGISLEVLQRAGYLPNNLRNPFGGTYSVSANATDNTRVDIVVTNIPDQYVHNEIASALDDLLYSRNYNASQKRSTFTF